MLIFERSKGHLPRGFHRFALLNLGHLSSKTEIHERTRSGNIRLSNFDGCPEFPCFEVEAKFGDRSDDTDYDDTHP